MYSECLVSDSFQEFEKKNLYFRNVFAVEVLQEFMQYRVEREKDGKRNYLDGTLMHLARSNA